MIIGKVNERHGNYLVLWCYAAWSLQATNTWSNPDLCSARPFEKCLVNCDVNTGICLKHRLQNIDSVFIPHAYVNMLLLVSHAMT